MHPEIHSTLLDEAWRPVYPQTVPVGGTMYAPSAPGRYLKHRRLVGTENELRFGLYRDDRGYARSCVAPGHIV